MGRQAALRPAKRARAFLGTTGMFGALTALIAMMALAPAGLAAHANGITLKAPYSGAVAPFTGVYTFGCSAAKTGTSWHFNLKTGLGGGAGGASAHACPTSSGGIGTNSYADSYGGFTVAVPVKFPAAGAVGDISASVSLAWTTTVKAKAASATQACHATPYTYNYTYGYYYDGSSVQYWPNWTGPFVYNSSTEYYYLSEYQFNQFCESFAESYGFLEGYVQDLSSGTTFPYAYSYPIDAITETYNQTYYYCYNYTYWYYGSWYNASYHCYSSNQSTTIYSYDNGLIGSSTTLTNTSSSSTTMWFNNTYNLRDKFEVYVYFDLYMDTAVQGWKGSASASTNMVAAGNGVRLTSITAS